MRSLAGRKKRFAQNHIAHLSTQYWIVMEGYCGKAEWKYLRISIGRGDL